jgi:hypothetical protein
MVERTKGIRRGKIKKVQRLEFAGDHAGSTVPRVTTVLIQKIEAVERRYVHAI